MHMSSSSSCGSMDDLFRLSPVLQRTDSVDYKALGSQLKTNMLTRFKCEWLRMRGVYLVKVLQVLNQAFQAIEEEGVDYIDAVTENQGAKEYIEDYKKRFKEITCTYKKLKKELRHSKSVAIQKELQIAKLYYVSMCYRIGEVYGGGTKKSKFNENRYQFLRTEALKWKKQNPLTTQFDLNFLEEDQLKEAACYPKWIKLLKSNEELKQSFFNRILLNYNAVEPVILCPWTWHRIDKEAVLRSYIGRIRKPPSEGMEEFLAFKCFKTKVEGVVKRVLTMPIYKEKDSFRTFDPSKQERINISDPKTVVCFGNELEDTTNVETIWKRSGRRTDEIDIEYQITPWGLIKYDRLAKKNRPIEELPPADIQRTDLLEAEYGPQARNKWIQMMATREHRGLVGVDCHAWVRYVDPDPDQKGWHRIVDIGDYPERYPINLIDKMTTPGKTSHKVCMVNDENPNYDFRQQGEVPAFDTDETGQNMELLRKEQAEKLANPGFFQFSTAHNCAGGAQTLVHKHLRHVPNCFSMPGVKGRSGFRIFDAYLTALEWIAKTARTIKVSERIVQTIEKIGVMAISFFFMGSWRALRIQQQDTCLHQSVCITQYKQEGVPLICNPSFLLYQIENEVTGFESGSITLSHVERLYKLYRHTKK